MTTTKINGTNKKPLFGSNSVSPVPSISKRVDEVYENPSKKILT
jgi:hypothetical protein